MFPLEDRIKQQAHALGFELAGITSATAADGFDRLRDWLARGFAGDMTYLHRRAEAYRHPGAVLPEVRSVVMVGMNYKPADDGPLGSSGPGHRPEMGSIPFPPTPLRCDALRPNATHCDALRPNATHCDPIRRIATQSDQAQDAKPSAAAPPDASPLPPSARVARYAHGADYHDVLRRRLNELLAWLQGEVPGVRGRGVVDTAPLLERDFARRAGLGWFGKNTMLLNKRQGSYFFLGALLLDLELRADVPHETAHCGTCTACLDACPTQAFTGPGWLDARRCISYLTIELRGPVPQELRPAVGDWLFGCDVCQEVCPWNRKAPPGREPAFRARPDLDPVDPAELLGLSEEAFRERFRGTALTRAKRRGLLRNAAIVLGNLGDPAALPALERALGDPEPLVREAARWAIGRLTGERCRECPPDPGFAPPPP
jgi:epoxyqueuosine reductase